MSPVAMEEVCSSCRGSRTRVFPITEEIARRAGVVRGALRRKGATRTQVDMLIAATAQTHGLTLVTRNERDFAGCSIAVLNPCGQASAE